MPTDPDSVAADLAAIRETLAGIGLDDDGLMRLDDDSRPGDPVAGGERLAQIDRRAVPSAGREEPRPSGRLRQLAFSPCLALSFLEAGAARVGADPES